MGEEEHRGGHFLGFLIKEWEEGLGVGPSVSQPRMGGLGGGRCFLLRFVSTGAKNARLKAFTKTRI